MEFELGCHGSERSAVGLLQRRCLLIYFSILFLVNGCAKKMPTMEPADLPVSLVMEKLEGKRNQLSSFRAVGSLKVKGGKKSWSGRAFILSRMPQSLRLEVLSPFLQPALYVVSDGNQFLFWEPGNDRAYRGFTSGNTLATLINFPLDDRETLLLLAGIVPSWDHQEARLFKVGDAQSLMLQLRDDPKHLTQRVWIEAEEFTVTRIERVRSGRLEMETTFADFAAIQGSLYPRSVMIKADKVVLRLKYKQFAINEPLQDETFQLALPEGIDIVPW
jgi:outer membrane lipoprotein-sorting protein